MDTWEKYTKNCPKYFVKEIKNFEMITRQCERYNGLTGASWKIEIVIESMRKHFWIIRLNQYP